MGEDINIGSIVFGPRLDPMPRQDLHLPPAMGEVVLAARIRELEAQLATVETLLARNLVFHRNSATDALEYLGGLDAAANLVAAFESATKQKDTANDK